MILLQHVSANSYLFSNIIDLLILVNLVTIMLYMSIIFHFLCLDFQELFQKLYLKKVDSNNEWQQEK